MLFGEDAIEEEPQPVEELPDSKKWIPSFSYKLGFGYSDNPMYGPYVREESGYLEMESELFVLRQGSRNSLTYLYLFGDGKWFEGLSEYDLSGILMAQAEHTYVTDDSAKSFGLRLRHTYYDQAFDFSDLGLPYSMQVQSNKSEVIPHLSHRFSEKITAKSRFRQAAKDLTIHRKTIPINSSGSPWIGRPPKSSMSRRRYPGERLITRVRRRRESDGSPCLTGSWKLKKSGSPWQWNASSHRLGSRKSGSTSRSINLEDNAGAITIMKGSE